MSTRFYDTDLTDAAWAWVAPVLPAARPGGRPRTTNLRAVLGCLKSPDSVKFGDYTAHSSFQTSGLHPMRVL